MTNGTRPGKLSRIGDATNLKSTHIPGARVLSRIFVRNTSASAFYFQIHDLSAADATTAIGTNTYVPSYPSFKVEADTTLLIDTGFSIRTGSLLAASSTDDVLTLVGSDAAQIVVES
jgi:hypothetical protein